MKPNILIAICGVAVGLSGCGGKDADNVSVPPPPSAPPVAAPSAVATTPPPAPEAPPPVAAASTMPAAPAEDPNATVELKDIDGKTLTAMQYVESIAQAYERTRAGQNDPNETPWPPLTDLNQLVARKFITRLPAAPAGQKFVYDPQTGKVGLAPK